jgi:hypothetical protein
MAHFLVGGGGFQNIVRDFGRPVVRHWTGVAAVTGGGQEHHAGHRVPPPVHTGRVEVDDAIDELTAPGLDRLPDGRTWG